MLPFLVPEPRLVEILSTASSKCTLYIVYNGSLQFFFFEMFYLHRNGVMGMNHLETPHAVAECNLEACFGNEDE